MDIWARARSREELEADMAGLGETLVQARQAYLETKAYDDALFGEDFGVQ